jgi:DnaK suppressor protein
MAGNGMIVSILQLMGFPMVKPVHSRAEESPQNQPTKASVEAQRVGKDAGASSTRRDQVNAKTGKDPKSKAVSAKVKTVAKAPAKPEKAAQAAKSPVKTPSKAVDTPKSSVKPPVKSPIKSSKPLAKAAEKSMTKPVAKAAAKPPAKAVEPSVAKPVAKTTAKATGKEAKALAPVAPPKPAVASKSAAKSAPLEKVAVPMTVVNKPVPAPAAPAAVAQKTGRPSSRLAQLTVPSMAQTVASTAAKASYSQSIPSPVIVPALPSSIKKDPKLANNWKTKPVAELTDADLMAMPDSEYMNDVQMGAFRLKLTILKQDILNSAGETTEHLREDTSVVPDPADRATIEEEHALELRTRDRERKLLKKIEQSIGRIDAGDYGYCDETGEPIGVGRLLARPTATLSLEAQQRRELKQKMFGD